VSKKEGHMQNQIKSLAYAVENLHSHLDKGVPDNLSVVFENLVALFNESGEPFAARIAGDYATLFHNAVEVRVLDKFDLEDECPECDVDEDDGNNE
jgi:hypothetical protein